MDIQLLKDLARHQAWADAQHWKTLHGNPALLEDAEILQRLNHMVSACWMLTTLALGETPDPAGMKEGQSAEELESALRQATERLTATVESVDLDKVVQLPRGPNGPFTAEAGALLLQAVMHGQHHRGQNAARMRALGISPPMTDYIFWYALGRP
jgi:uncharacterized damage-inducible protein DinB